MNDLKKEQRLLPFSVAGSTIGEVDPRAHKIDTLIESLYAHDLVAMRRPERRFPKPIREVIQNAEGMADIHRDG